MAKVKVVYVELIKIRHCLQKLAALDLPIPYELAKNLRRVNEVLKEPDELIEDVRKKFADKDENGEPIQYAMNKQGDIVPFDLAHRKDFDLNSRAFTDITNEQQMKEFREQVKDIEIDSFEVDFHQIKMSKLQEFMKKPDLPKNLGNLFEPLLDIILVEAE